MCVCVYEWVNVGRNRALKCHALSVTVTRFGLLSRSPATHRISYVEKQRLEKFTDLGRSGRRDDQEFTDPPVDNVNRVRKTAKDGPSSRYRHARLSSKTCEPCQNVKRFEWPPVRKALYNGSPLCVTL